MKFHLYGQQTFVELPNGTTVQDLRALAYFNRIIKNYAKMCRIERTHLLSAQNNRLMRESRIQGQAVAIFGGQIGIRVGYDKESGYAVLCLCELVEDHKPGDKLKKGWDSYGEQIQLAFKDLKSINIVRTALDYVERTIKDGKLPGEWLDEDEK